MKGSRSGVTSVVLFGVLSLFLPLYWAVGEEGVTDTEIKIGSIQDTAGPIAAYGVPRVEAAQAVFKYINDQGGINGRKIVYVNESDNYEPAKAVLAFKKLLDVDKVFCFVSGLGVAPTNAVVPEVQNRKAPYLMIGGNASKFFFPPKRYVFGVWATFEDYMRLLVDYVAIDLKMPDARVAHIFQDDETGRDSQKGFEEQVAKYPGMVIVATEGFKRGTVDVSAPVLKAKEAKAEVVMMSCIFVSSAMIAKEIEKIGWKPVVMMNSSSQDAKLIQLGGSAVEGAIVQNSQPLLDEDLPGLRLYKDIIKRYFPDSKTNHSSYGLSSFAEVQLAAEALRRAGRNLTREGLIDTLENSFKEVDIGCLPPITYGPQKHWGMNQVIHMKVQNGQFVKIASWRSPR